MADIHALIMPKWGLSMEEGQLLEWLVAEGDEIGIGDEVAEVETSKITNTVEARSAGVLRRRVASSGDTLAVGALLGVIASADTDEAAIEVFVREFEDSFVPQTGSGEGASPGPRTVEVLGRRISYLAASDADGVPAILIHGFGGDSGNWLFNLNDLAAERPVYAVDLPGHGASDKAVGDGTLAGMAEAVLGFMDALGIEATHVVGHSMGGGVAMELVRAACTRIESLTLIAPTGLGETINEDYISGFISAESRRDLKPVLQLLFADQSLVSRDMVQDVLRYKRLDGVRAALASIAESVFPEGRQAVDYRDELTGTPRTLVVWGDADRIVNPAAAGGLPEAVRVEMLEAGHMPQMERAGAVNKLLQEHFAVDG